MKKELDLINKYQREIILLGNANALLNWDEETYMPHEGLDGRAEGAALLSKLAHERMTSNELFSAVKKLQKIPLKGKDKIMIDKLYRELRKSRKLPHEFVEELSRATTLATASWRKARKENSFEIFRPHLEKIVELKKKQAKYIGFTGHSYNALLDDFEEGMTAEKIKPVFDKLKADLVLLLGKIKKSKEYSTSEKILVKKNFTREGLEKLGKDLVRRMGMKEGSSRVDLSEHPFTTKIAHGDVRITTNYRDSPMFSFLSTAHEAGHALYELGMPNEDAYNFLGGSPSMGLHESQSRLWENQVAKSKNFWKFYFPRFKKEFGLRCSLEEFYKEVNLVYPHKIRIECDEVHYVLHIILRFEIELGLIDGSIKVKDLPRVWNSKVKELIGAEVKNDVEGCMQDVHWSNGLFGYFPTYALGSIYAAQFYEAMRQEIKDLDARVARGDFDKAREWLTEKVHKHGAKYLAEDVVKKACGKGLSPDAFVNYLNEKYSKIYGF